MSNNIKNWTNTIYDFYDIVVPRKVSDFPKSTLRLLALERARENTLIRYLKKTFIPITHILERTIDWENADKIPEGTVKDRSEYGEDLEISSLSRLKGERAYIQALKRGRMT